MSAPIALAATTVGKRQLERVADYVDATPADHVNFLPWIEGRVIQGRQSTSLFPGEGLSHSLLGA